MNNVVDKNNVSIETKETGGIEKKSHEEKSDGEKKEEKEEESQILEEKKLYLLTDSLFSKFSHLLNKRTNLDFIQKLKSTPLIHGERYYPIDKKEYDFIVNYVKSIIEGKNIKEVKVESSTPSTVPTLAPTKIIKPVDDASVKFSNPNSQFDLKTSQPTFGQQQPSFLSSPATSVSGPLISPMTKSMKQKLSSKTDVWKPNTWLIYQTKTAKKDG